MYTTCTAASGLLYVDILSFISAGRAKRGRTSQHDVVRLHLFVPTRELAGKVERPSSRWTTFNFLAEMMRGTCS